MRGPKQGHNIEDKGPLDQVLTLEPGQGWRRLISELGFRPGGARRAVKPKAEGTPPGLRGWIPVRGRGAAGDTARRPQGAHPRVLPRENQVFHAPTPGTFTVPARCFLNHKSKKKTIKILKTAKQLRR